ncbi:MAG: recombinase family protein [Oscillospiraceae bacterium]|nr:recombinase family protein [Oscillospiraceae bacterium]
MIIKDFSRFSRRNSKGLVELEDLRDVGVRIIAIGDNIDYPTCDDWTAIQFRFLINEMPMTDTSKKVKSVVSRRQSEGKWLCAVPYGYIMTNTKAMTFTIDEAAAVVVREIFDLYNCGWGYKKIANHLTDKQIPTPRMSEKFRRESAGEDSRIKAKDLWSIVIVSEILQNDFYIGTLRQGKYRRKKINGSDIKAAESEHIIFENHHEPIIDYRVFWAAQEQRSKRTTTHYRGVKKYSNSYSGFLFCGDCGEPLFSRSNPKSPAYICSSYHKRGLKACTSHHTREDLLDKLLKSYVCKVKDNSAEMLDKLNQSLKDEKLQVTETTNTIALLQQQVDDAKAEMKVLARQKTRELMREPEKEDIIDEMYAEMLDELADRISGLQNQIELTANRHATAVKVNRIAKTAMDIFDDILSKDTLNKSDIELIIDRITVYEDHIEIQLKTDIDAILQCGISDGIIELMQISANRKPKSFNVNVVNNGDRPRSSANSHKITGRLITPCIFM